MSLPPLLSSPRPLTLCAPRERHCPGANKAGGETKAAGGEDGDRERRGKAAPERGRGSGSRCCCSPRLAEPRARQTLSARPAPPLARRAEPGAAPQRGRRRRRRGSGGGGGAEAAVRPPLGPACRGRRRPRLRGRVGGAPQGLRFGPAPREEEGKVREAARGRREAAVPLRLPRAPSARARRSPGRAAGGGGRFGRFPGCVPGLAGLTPLLRRPRGAGGARAPGSVGGGMRAVPRLLPAVSLPSVPRRAASPALCLPPFAFLVTSLP